MTIDDIAELLEESCDFADDAISWANKNFRQIGSGNHSQVFDIDGEYVLKISSNTVAYDIPDVPEELSHYLEYHFGHGGNLNYAFAFQRQADALLSEMSEVPGEYEYVYNLLDDAGIVSPQWQWGAWAENDYKLDLALTNWGIFDGQIKAFDY